MDFVDSLVKWTFIKNVKQERTEVDDYNLAMECDIKTEEPTDDTYNEKTITGYNQEELIEITKSEVKPGLICNICSRFYLEELHLEKHLYSVHRPLTIEIKGKVYCCKCHNWFKTEIDYEEHGPCYAFKAKCILCDIDTSEFLICQLNLHMKQKHEQPGLFECLQCMLYFVNCKAIKQHIADIHSGSQSDTNTVCVCPVVNINGNINTKPEKLDEIKTETQTDNKFDRIGSEKVENETFTRLGKPLETDYTEPLIDENIEYSIDKVEHEISWPLGKSLKTDFTEPQIREDVKYSSNKEIDQISKENDYPLVVNKTLNATYKRPERCSRRINNKSDVDGEYPLRLNKSTNVTYSRQQNCIDSMVQKDNISLPPEVSDKSKILSETVSQNQQDNLNNTKKRKQDASLNIVWKRVHEEKKPKYMPTKKCVLNNSEISTSKAENSIDLPEVSTDSCLLENLLNVGQMPSDLVTHISNIIILNSEITKFYKDNAKTNADVLTKEKSLQRNKNKQQNNDTTIYSCKICHSTFTEQVELNSHNRLVHRPWAVEMKRKLYCPGCETWFNDEKIYTGHHPCHKFGVRRKCPICYTDNPDIDHFSLHKVIYKSNFYCCTICDNNLTTYRIKELNIHRQKVHNHNGVFECVECAINFPYLYTLKTHILKHKSDSIHSPISGDQQAKSKKIKLKHYKCKICYKVIFDVSNIRKHLKTHEGCLCSVCGQSFRQSHHLNAHFNGKHAKNVFFTCKICNRKFPYQKSLTQHMKIHKVQKNFNCDVCQQSFTQQTSLIYHMASHTNENIFTCTVCNIKFDLQSKLSSHMQIHTANGTNPHICKICDKAFTHECNLLVHKRTHIDLQKSDLESGSKTVAL